VNDLGPADERPLVDDGPLAGRIEEHRAGLIGALNDGDELQLVDRVLRELHLALVERLSIRRLLLDEEAAERIAIAITLDEVVLRVLRSFELGRQAGGRGRRGGCDPRGRRRGRLGGDGRVPQATASGRDARSVIAANEAARFIWGLRVRVPGAPARGVLGVSAWNAVARQRACKITSSPTSFGSVSSMFSTLMMRSTFPSSNANLAIWWNLPDISSFIGTFA